MEEKPFANLCRWCVRWHRGEEHPTCEAFPDGIPAPFWAGEALHTEPVDGDHGIQFRSLSEGINPPTAP